MFKYLSLCALLALGACAGNQPLQGSDVHARLTLADAAAGYGEYGYSAVQDYLRTHPVPLEQFNNASTFMAEKTVQLIKPEHGRQAKSDPRYILLHSEIMMSLGVNSLRQDVVKATVVAHYAAGATWVQQDIVRCDDAGVGANLLARIGANDARMRQLAATLTPQGKASARSEYDKLVAASLNRAPSRYACKSGAGYMARLMSPEYADKVVKTPVKVNKGNHIGQLIVLDDRNANIPINFVADEVWKPKAEEIIQRNRAIFE